ncbi:MAG: DNA/RNA non-specific endonuclease [Lachnospiraceae bacterium]|nr:DNA/RNA non-specific endonuclease [Lachnospiraceae bacterium]
MKYKKRIAFPLFLALVLVFSVSGMNTGGRQGLPSVWADALEQSDSDNTVSEDDSSGDEESLSAAFVSDTALILADIPAYSGSPYAEVNGNVPDFSDADMNTESFESYSEMDSLGRCGVAFANLGEDLMPTQERGDIRSIHPTGWHSVQYEGIDGESLYNRCHLIAYKLAAENANERNLITGTRYLNTEGMLPFEDLVAEYIYETGNHVLYRVTPVFEGENLVASGVQMEAMSVEDEGTGILFNIYCYNVQPGIGIDYATGDSWIEDAQVLAASAKTSEETSKETTAIVASGDESGGETSASERTVGDEEGTTYILNRNTMKFHDPGCSSVDDMSEKNKLEYTGDRETVIAMGYSPCQICNP